MSKQQISRLSFEKIFYHRKHLLQVLKVGEAYPIHLELGLVNYCNHDCTFCYASRSMFDAKGIGRTRIDRTRLMEIIQEMAELGLRSVTLVGSGEPTLHPETSEIVREIKAHGVDVALFTNGSGLRPSVNRAVVDCCTFVRFSLTGASKKIHNLVHANDDYDRIVQNLREMVAMRGAGKLPTIGVQFVLASYSAEDVVRGAKQARDLGVDYFEIKPCFPAPAKSDQKENVLRTDDAIALMREARQYETDKFKVYAKEDQLVGVFRNEDDRVYNSCPGCLTTTTLEADFNLYICDNQKVPQFCFGNLLENSFRTIWYSDRRRRILEELNVHHCPPRCRMDPLNVIYHEIRNGERHIPDELGEPNPEIHANFL